MADPGVAVALGVSVVDVKKGDDGRNMTMFAKKPCLVATALVEIGSGLAYVDTGHRFWPPARWRVMITLALLRMACYSEYLSTTSRRALCLDMRVI